ncbi:tyrosine protein phosphatase 5 [Patellaria atrata CBS 101060]|uniref:Tyrosine protein phosphatase 5 n=1 Tax=Patellaria atrata CBS 101060 TaxID=1346257 RepID=A0A9P4VXE0_9PEZI|nr:tyrosine protein phosphatase 5 [Patellaria atrata CBS 101060]
MASPLPSPPFHHIPGIHNFRDIHGPVTQTVKRGIVYRCAGPDAVTAEGIKRLRGLRVKVVFDLRSTPFTTGDGPVTDIERIWTPAFRDEDYSPEKIAVRYRDYGHGGADGFARAYMDMLAAGPSTVARILRWIADFGTLDSACVIHCTAGKDRTGIFVAVLLSMLGVGDEDVAKEYELTIAGLTELMPFFIEKLSANPVFKDRGEEGREAVLRMVTARKENMIAALEALNRTYGNAEQYLRDVCGLESEVIERLRSRLPVATIGNDSNALTSSNF